MKKETHKIKTVQWFLDFLSDDLDNMDEINFLKRVIEAKHFLTQPHAWIIQNYDMPKLAGFVANELCKSGIKEKRKRKDFITNLLLRLPSEFDFEEEINEVLEGLKNEKEFFRKISENADKKKIFKDPPPDYPWKQNLKKIQRSLKAGLEGMRSVYRGLYPNLCPQMDLTLFAGVVDGKIRSGYDIPTRYLKDRVNDDYEYDPYEPEDLSSLSSMSFYQAFEGIELESIKNCRECKRYFLQLSKKPKFYCSAKCTTKAVSRKRREKNPEEYRAKQREIMRKKYAEQRKGK